MNYFIRSAAAVVVAVLFLLATLRVHADSPAETLEKGIYNEETTGNLGEAIKHYRQVLADAKKIEGLAVQAQYRLGRCLLKLGKKKEAEAAFRALIKNYPEQSDFVAKAKKLLPAQLKLLPAPWETGEQLTLTMMLTGGRRIGLIGTAVTAGQQDGKPVWKMIVRRHIAGGTNGGVSSVIVDQKTNLPIATDWDHTLLGSAKGAWTSEQVVITQTTKEGKQETKTVRFDSPGYSNDQWMFGFRQLPLKVGYKVTVPVRVAFTGGNEIGMEIDVTAKEEITTPVGKFKCFRLDTNIAQTFWITDTPQRYIARFDAGGVTALLTAIEKGDSAELKNEKLGFSVTKPGGWFHYLPESDNETTSGGLRLVAPTAIVSAALNVRKKTLLEEAERKSPADWADSIVQSAKDRYKDVKVRENSRQDVQFAGNAGVTMVLQYNSGGRAMTASPSLAFSGEKAVELAVYGDAKQFDGQQKILKTLRESITVKE